LLRRFRSIEDHLRPREHICFFYEGKTDLFQVVIPFLAGGLTKEERCLYIADENSAAEIKAGLLMHGLDVRKCLESGQLRVDKARMFPIRHGFDAQEMISLDASAVKEALTEGYSGLRIAGEASWILHDLSGLEGLMRCETVVNTVLRDLPLKALCLYNARRFSGNVILKVLRTHPRVLLGLDLYESQFYQPSTPRGEARDPSDDFQTRRPV